MKRVPSKLSLSLFIVLGLLIGLGCSKSSGNGSSTGDYYFRFKVNGADVNYNSTVQAAYYPGTTNVNVSTQGVAGYSAIISASANINQVARNAISVVINSPALYQTGLAYTTAANSNLGLMQFGYYDASGTLYLASKSISMVGSMSTASVQYTEITDDQIAGTFSGKLYTSNQQNFVDITAGEFRVKRRP